ncbi:hypothetical protein IC229_33570 [Spirosoma sp. BT702]|uniref:Uncharacterized protein n=1 Tax=Spirosoma profusum TaxID=2771354 RepID=A0A927AWC5_9BACT|nr:hypothetical protein [Spirosoma profusum]MBD2705586.1 hypothetical protein [Spirosoma profusum]
MMMEETQLTLPQLARFMGKKVQYEAFAYDEVLVSCGWVQRIGILTLEILLRYNKYQIEATRNIRPYLRPMESLTEEEMAVMMQKTFGWRKPVPVKYHYDVGNTDHSFEANGYVLHLSTYRQDCKVWDEGDGIGQYFNPFTLHDYLDELGIDYRNWIPQGLALATNNTPQP